MSDDLLNDVRALLLTFDDITAIVGERIRPYRADSTDENTDLIILDLPDADQTNLLSREQIIEADLIIRTRSTDKTQAMAIANAVKGTQAEPRLDGYSGPAGDGQLIQCNRREFSGYEVDDDDDDDDSHYETESLFSVWYQTS